MRAIVTKATFLLPLVLQLVGLSPQSVVADNQPSALGIPLGADRRTIEEIFEKAQIRAINAGDGGNSICYYEQAPKRIKDGGRVMLVFHEEKLAKIVLLIEVESQRVEPYLSRYRSLKENLTKKYGKPKQAVESMDSSCSKHPLLAIKTGKARYISLWETRDLTIGLKLAGDNFNVHFNLQYEYGKLFDKYIKSKDDEEASNL